MSHQVVGYLDSLINHRFTTATSASTTTTTTPSDIDLLSVDDSDDNSSLGLNVVITKSISSLNRISSDETKHSGDVFQFSSTKTNPSSTTTAAAAASSSVKNKKIKKIKKINDKTTTTTTKKTTTTKTTTTEKVDVNKKLRVNRYCPKQENIEFNLECEWNDCDEIFNNMDDYLTHLDEHLKQISEDSSTTSISDNSDKESNKNFECQWRECDNSSFNCKSLFERHVRFHAFHTKLKQIGLNVLKSLKENAAAATANAATTTGSTSTPQNVVAVVPKCNLDEQTRNVIPELPFKFECSWSTCDYSTDNPELFYRHIRIHVENYSKKFENEKCMWSECDQIIANRNRLVEHIRHHSQEKLVSCPVCGALFSTFTKFIDHCSRSSQLGSLCFQCSHCNKKFATNNLLKEHIRKHINKCKCPICDMTCIDKNDLSKHILYKHTSHKAFKCNLCDHSCKSQYDLQKHINMKHNERYEYQCNECEFKTKDVNNMKRHMLKFHLNSENPINLNDGQQFSSSYMCHVCNKVYCQGSTLSRHLKTSHNFQWPSGHSRFRYKLETDGYYRLQTLRYESAELVEQLNKNALNPTLNEQNSENVCNLASAETTTTTETNLNIEQLKRSHQSIEQNTSSMDFQLTSSVETSNQLSTTDLEYMKPVNSNSNEFESNTNSLQTDNGVQDEFNLLPLITDSNQTKSVSIDNNNLEQNVIMFNGIHYFTNNNYQSQTQIDAANEPNDHTKHNNSNQINDNSKTSEKENKNILIDDGETSGVIMYDTNNDTTRFNLISNEHFTDQTNMSTHHVTNSFMLRLETPCKLAVSGDLDTSFLHGHHSHLHHQHHHHHHHHSHHHQHNTNHEFDLENFFLNSNFHLKSHSSQNNQSSADENSSITSINYLTNEISNIDQHQTYQHHTDCANLKIDSHLIIKTDIDNTDETPGSMTNAATSVSNCVGSIDLATNSTNGANNFKMFLERSLY